MKATPTTAPITIPAMAPPERPPEDDSSLLLLCSLPATGTDDAVGVASGSVMLKQGNSVAKLARSM